jgi:hypothetical protein
MADIYTCELRAALSGRLSFDEFIKAYFQADHIGHEYVNSAGEKLPIGIAEEFYDDYITSGRSIEKYIKNTTSAEVF